MQYVFCRPLLCMAEKNKRKPERIAQRILSQGKESVESKPCDIKKGPGAYKRQVQKSFAFRNTTRFVL